MAADVIFADLLLKNCRIVRISGQFPRIPHGVETGIVLHIVADFHMFGLPYQILSHQAMYCIIPS
jgi:hypothetical protein